MLLLIARAVAKRQLWLGRYTNGEIIGDHRTNGRVVATHARQASAPLLFGEVEQSVVVTSTCATSTYDRPTTLVHHDSKQAKLATTDTQIEHAFCYRQPPILTRQEIRNGAQ